MVPKLSLKKKNRELKPTKILTFYNYFNQLQNSFLVENCSTRERNFTSQNYSTKDYFGNKNLKRATLAVPAWQARKPQRRKRRRQCMLSGNVQILSKKCEEFLHSKSAISGFKEGHCIWFSLSQRYSVQRNWINKLIAESTMTMTENTRYKVGPSNFLKSDYQFFPFPIKK